MAAEVPDLTTLVEILNEADDAPVGMLTIVGQEICFEAVDTLIETDLTPAPTGALSVITPTEPLPPFTDGGVIENEAI